MLWFISFNLFNKINKLRHIHWFFSFLVFYLITYIFFSISRVNPFINSKRPIHCNTAKNKGYLMKSISGSLNTTWWNGVYSYIDFTNSMTAARWFNVLRNLIAISGINTLKFDAGESNCRYVYVKYIKMRFTRKYISILSA